MLGNLISFARGVPASELIDVEGLGEATVRALSDDPAGATAYGTAGGYGPLRQWLAERHGVQTENVMVTNGSLQADSLLFDELATGCDVVVEDPTYDRTFLGLRRRARSVHALRLDDDGLSLEELDALLASEVRPSLVHVIPNFQNPNGTTMSIGVRMGLLQRAREYGFTIFEDDPYIDLRFSGTRLAPMLELDDTGSVVYASSFSKTVCPGVRVGYIVGEEPLIRRLVTQATNTYLSPSMFSQATVYQFCISDALERSIKNMSAGLLARRDAMTRALRRDMPEAKFVEPQGGYFLWLELPDDVDVSQLETEAERNGVAFVPGRDFSESAAAANAIRLAYSGVSTEDIGEGISRLGAAVEAARQASRR